MKIVLKINHKAIVFLEKRMELIENRNSFEKDGTDYRFVKYNNGFCVYINNQEMLFYSKPDKYDYGIKKTNPWRFQGEYGIFDFEKDNKIKEFYNKIESFIQDKVQEFCIHGDEIIEGNEISLEQWNYFMKFLPNYFIKADKYC